MKKQTTLKQEKPSARKKSRKFKAPTLLICLIFLIFFFHLENRIFISPKFLNPEIVKFEKLDELKKMEAENEGIRNLKFCRE